MEGSGRSTGVVLIYLASPLVFKVIATEVVEVTSHTVFTR